MTKRHLKRAFHEKVDPLYNHETRIWRWCYEYFYELWKGGGKTAFVGASKMYAGMGWMKFKAIFAAEYYIMQALYERYLQYHNELT